MSIKIRNKIAAMCAVFLVGAGAPAFSQAALPGPDLAGLSRALDEFSASMALALPFNASMGLNTSDAHIGTLFPFPPRFSVGLTAGATTMDSSSIENLLGMFDFHGALPGGGRFPIPGIMADIRLGGFVMPFDVGFKIGLLEIGFDAAQLDYFVIGGDFRYAVLRGRGLLPTVSVGVGFTRMRGGIGVSAEDLGFGFAFEDQGTGQAITGTLNVTDPQIGIAWSADVLDFKAQVSKRFFFITPYLGLGASHGWSRVSYGANAGMSIYSSHNITLENLGNEFGINIDEMGMSSEISTRGWSFRAFGGFSLNLLALRIDFTGLYNLRDRNFGGTVGVRIQI